MQYATKLFTAFLNVRNQLILKKKDIARKDCFSCKKSADQIIASRHEENWGGLNKNTEKNSKALYFDNEFLFNKKLSKIPVIKNGNCFHLAPIEIGNKLVTVTYTCPFDSMFQLILSTYIDRDAFKLHIDQLSENNAFFRMIHKVAEFGINRGTYVQRAEILLPICDRQNMIENTPDGIIVEENSRQKINKKSKAKFIGQNLQNVVVDCAAFIDKTCAQSMEETSSLEKEVRCNKCYKVRNFKRKFLSVSSELLKMNNFETIFKEEVKHQLPKCSEKNCDGVVKSTITKTGNHL